MRLDRIYQIQARISAIERKLDEFNNSSDFNAGRTSGSFAGALLNAHKTSSVPCPDEFHSMINRAGDKYGIDPAVIKAVIRAESGFRPDAVSPAGARGLMQLMPGTADSLGVDPMDPEECIEGGTRYLKQMIDRFGSIDLGLAAYNAGPGSVARFNGIPPYEETRRYVDKVLRYMDDYSEE